MKRVRAEIYVSGSVQGVGYRAFALRVAHSLGIKGYVKNLYDGRVEVVAEGEENSVNLLIHRLRQGPSYSRVSDVEVRWGEYTGEYSGFHVRW
ncbi:MAG: acylphosphatase [bacterium]